MGLHKTVPRVNWRELSREYRCIRQSAEEVTGRFRQPIKNEVEGIEALLPFCFLGDVI